MAPVPSSRLAQLAEAARGRLGSTAHFATGDDVPGAIAPPVDRRPAAAMPPMRMHAQSMPLRDFEALAAKAAANPAALTVEEVLVLLDAGADPSLVMPQVPLTAAQRDDIIRRVQRGEAITPGEIDRLRQTPTAEPELDAPAAEPQAPAVEAATGEARPFADVGGGRLVGEDGMSLTALDDGERFVYEDGTVVDVMGNIVGRQAPGALEDVVSTDVDNLAASAMEIAEEGDAPRGGTRNLTPKTAKPDALAQLGQSIFQITTPTDLESVSQQTLKSLLRRAQQYRRPDGSYDPKFLASINRDPAYAAGRLAALEQMAGVSNADRAAEQIDTAAQAVAAANTPRPPAGNRPAALADVEAARQLVAESLPEGDWATLTDAFNQLDDQQRSAVLAALPLDTRRFLSGMMDPAQQSPAFLPNRVSESLRPINDVDDLVAQREAARLAGNQAEVDAINEVLQGANAAPQEDIVEAIRAFNERRAAADRLRSAMIAQNELVQPEIARMRQAFTPQPQPAVATPGARTPEFAAEDVPDAEMPTAYDQAIAEANDARLARERRAPGGGIPAAKRLASAKEYLLRKSESLPLDDDQRAKLVAQINAITMEDLPLFLKGSDNPIPFDVRSQGARAEYVSPSGQKRLANLKALEDEAAQAYAALDAVDGVAEWRSSVQAADAALQKAERAAARASGTGKLAKAVQNVEAARAAYNAAVGSNPAAQAALRRIDAANSAIDKMAPGVASRKTGVGTTDKRLNKASPAATYSDVVSGVTGFKNPDGRVMDRSSVGLDPADARAMRSEARRVFGKDMEEFTDGAEGADEAFTVSPNRRALAQSAISIEDGGVRKPGRLGGNRSQSRTMGSGTALFRSRDFGDFNPLEMIDPETGAPLFRDADAVAADILSRDSQYTTESGAAQQIAKEELAKYVTQSFGDAVKPEQLNDFDGVDDALRAAQGGDASPIQPVESSNVTDNLEASAVTVDDTPATDAAKPKGRRGKKASAKKDDATGTAAAGDSPVQPVTGNQKSVAEIQAEANQVEAQARREALDSGMSKTEADKAARKARKAHVDAEMAARGKGTASPAPDAPSVTPVSGSAKPVGDASATPAPAADATPSAAAADAAVKPVDGDAKPVDAGGKKADSDSGKSGKPDGGNAPEKKKGSLLKKAAVGTALVGGGLIGGGIVLDRLSSGGGGGQDAGWRLPPGAGGPPGSPDVFPIPVGAGGDGSSLMGEEAPMTEEERITDALARLRRARAMNTEGPSQTVLNYHAGWR